jgi:CRISPR-associated protein Csm4
MQLYRSTLRLRSASASAWRADTLFGHLCWSLVRREGADFLSELFLPEYRAGQVPVLLSDGFPSGYLPRPRASGWRSAGDRVPKPERVAGYREVKDFLKVRWLTLEQFDQARKGELVSPGPQPKGYDRVVSKNQIDRLMNTAGGTGGHLYDFAEICLPAVDVFWRIGPGYEVLVRDFLADLEQTGYGKRKSAGYGQIESWSLDPFAGFGDVPQANGFVTLSNFVPQGSDPTDGFWMTTVKYGKLGEEGAVSGHPFKRPLIQLESGSCFYDTPVRDWYGRLVTEVAADPQVVQYAYAFPLPMRLPDRS